MFGNLNKMATCWVHKHSKYFFKEEFYEEEFVEGDFEEITDDGFNEVYMIERIKTKQMLKG